MSWYIDGDGRIWPLDDGPEVPWWIDPGIEETLGPSQKSAED